MAANGSGKGVRRSRAGEQQRRKPAPSANARELEDLRHDVDALAESLESVLQSEDWIQAKLYDLNVALAALAPPSEESSDTPRVDPGYAQTMRKIRETVRRILPRDATVVVVSKGDEALLDLYGRDAWHFPRAADGTYLWYYPPDGPSVIAQLETLRIRGAEYLLFPEPAFWWLERYPEFGSHLHNHYPVVVEDDSCVIFSLAEDYSTMDRASWAAKMPGLITDFVHETGDDPAILDWNTGLQLKETFPSLAVFTPPEDSPRLPYFDNSVDVVVVPESDPDALCEARRVAGFAVVSVAAPDRDRDAPATGDEHHLEANVERVKGHAVDAGVATTSIVIPTHNGVEHLQLCLASLQRALPEPFAGEVIVVDDGSGAEMQAMLDEWKTAMPYLRVIRNAQNRGFVASCNRGARAAKADILVFLNDDTIPQVGWLRALLRTFRERPDAGAVGGKLIYPDGRLQEAGNFVFSDGSAANFGRDDRLVDAPFYSHLREVDYCSGALLATPRALFAEIGGFDKRYEPGYYEDTDYCFEVRRHGRRVYYQPESLVVHTEGGTGGTDLSSGAKRFQVVNQGKFAKKWKDALRRQPKRPAQLDASALHGLALKTASR
jgi:GT2 family glycosyltransferase